MRNRYHEFRKFGHGRLLSLLHAPTSGQLFAGACVIGLILGVYL